MAFELLRRERDGVPIVELHGRLMMGEPVEAFRSMLEQLEAEGHTSGVLDMRDVDYIDSTGLGSLVYTHTRAQKAGGKIAMFGLSARQLELMVLTKLSVVFPLFEHEIDAVNACIPGRESRKFDILEFIEKQRSEPQKGQASR